MYEAYVKNSPDPAPVDKKLVDASKHLSLGRQRGGGGDLLSTLRE